MGIQMPTAESPFLKRTNFLESILGSGSLGWQI